MAPRGLLEWHRLGSPIGLLRASGLKGRAVMRVVRGVCLAITVVAIALAHIASATAADLGQVQQIPESPPSGWQFSFTGYGWLTSVDGNATARGHTVEFDESFIDLVEKSDSIMALMGFAEA